MSSITSSQAHAYSVTIQRSTSIQNAVVCSFTSPTDRNLIISKNEYIEVHTITDNGLIDVFTTHLNGQIVSIGYYRPSNMQQHITTMKYSALYYATLNTKDVLVILTARSHFTILSWDHIKNKINAKATGNLNERGIGREIDYKRLIIDPNYRLLGMLLLAGYIKVIPIEGNQLKEACNIRLPTNDCRNMIDCQFLHGCAKPTICILTELQRGSRSISTYVVDLKEKELVDGSWRSKNIDDRARMLIPVPSPTNGVLVISDTSITYMHSINGRSIIQGVFIEASVHRIISHSLVDVDGTRFIIGDDAGDLYILVLEKDQNNVVISAVMDKICNGAETKTIPQTINYLDNGVVFLGSMLADSQLIKLSSGSSSNSSSRSSSSSSSSIEILDTYTNLGPIIDMCVVESAQQIQSQIVTCSGGGVGGGSLRIVKSGIGIYSQATVPIDGIKSMWSLFDPLIDMTHHRYLVQSFISETRILGITDHEMDEVEITGFKSDEATLYSGNFYHNTLVQVTASGIYLVSAESLELKASLVMDAGKEITVAAGNYEQLAIALFGGLVMYVEYDVSSNALVYQSTYQVEHDVACLSIQTISSNDLDRSCYLAVGLWTDNTVRLLSLPQLTLMQRIQIDGDSQVRNVMLVNFTRISEGNGSTGTAEVPVVATRPRSFNYLLIGLGCGSIVTYQLDIVNGVDGLSPSHVNLSSRRKVTLGIHPVSFTYFRSEGNPCVFAISDRPTILYASGSNKLLFSMVSTSSSSSRDSSSDGSTSMIIDDTNTTTGSSSSSSSSNSNNTSSMRYKGCMTPFHSAMFPDCLALSSGSSLTICTVDRIQKIHIKTKVLDDKPRRILHHPDAGMYVVCTAGNDGCRVLFYDEVTFDLIHFETLDDCEECISMSVLLDDGKKDVSSSSSVMGDNEAVAPDVTDTDPNTTGSSSSSSSGSLQKKYIVVGSAYYIPEEFEPSRGKIRVFSVSDNRRVSSLCVKETRGAVFSLAPLCSCKLVAAIGNRIDVLALVDIMASRLDDTYMGNDCSSVVNRVVLEEEVSKHGFIIPAYVKALNNYVLVGDLLKSVVVFQYKGTGILEEVGRDFGCNAMRAVEILSENMFLGTDDYQNIFIASSPAVTAAAAGGGSGTHSSTTNGSASAATAIADEDRGVLVSTCEFNVADTINVFRKGTFMSFDKSDYIDTRRTVLYGTITGAIGAIISIDSDSYRLFHAIEHAVKSVVGTVGSLSHDDHRAFHISRRSNSKKNVIDGDLVERIFDLKRDDIDAVVKLANYTLSNAAPSSVFTGSASASTAVAYTPISVEECLNRIEEMCRFR